MNKTIDALKLAEEALEKVKKLFRSMTADECPDDPYISVGEALAAIREALAEPVKQEPIDDELKAKLDAFSDLKTILFEPERWTVSEHATYFGFFCWGWKYAKKPYAAPVDAKAILETERNRHAFELSIQEELFADKAEAIRAEALEEAAKVCDFENHQLTGMRMDNEAWAAKNCAAAIRGLK